jgi:hypothetical protein
MPKPRQKCKSSVVVKKATFKIFRIRQNACKPNHWWYWIILKKKSIIHIVSATRFLLRYTMRYCKLLVQKCYWWWTITCWKHVEDKLCEIDCYEKCASCWSFSRMCIAMHSTENVNRHISRSTSQHNLKKNELQTKQGKAFSFLRYVRTRRKEI